MVDVFSKEKRSEVMSNIRSSNTLPEIIVRKYLFSKGFRFRVNQKRLPGCPDIVLKKYNTIIFIHGCFWHGHMDKNCKLSKIPKSNTSFWLSKIKYNQSRDVINQEILEKEGWKVFVVWECQLRGNQKQTTLNLLVKKII